MAGKPKSMSQIKQLLLLHQQGKGKKTIARLLGMSRATVKVYLQKLQLLTSPAKGTMKHLDSLDQYFRFLS
jgi:predicted transcriptional regulator